jgi:ubiquinone/menaquinone biosynthesis C-methylase UbiE
MFFPGQLRALREFRRVLKSGGRLGVSIWRVSQTSKIEAAMAELGISNPRPPGWITEADALSTILTTAGFTDVRVDESPHMFRYASRDQ